MPNPSKFEKAIAFATIAAMQPIHLKSAKRIHHAVLRRWGVQMGGEPGYISPKVALDGTDYSLISIGAGVTISSYVRVLTHDWSAHTVAKALGIHTDEPLGSIRRVAIGEYSFVGTGSIIMPGATIGRGCIIGAGTVIRGTVPDYAIMIGSPCEQVGDTRTHLTKRFPQFSEIIASTVPRNG